MGLRGRGSIGSGRRASAAAAAVLAAVLPLATLAAAQAPAQAADVATVTSQANWILGAQMPNGAIAAWPDRPNLRLVWPYLSNFAAMGLARAATVTGNAAYSSAAWAYLRWYASAENPTTGYVTDYNIVGGTELVSNGHYDSTDAYAGTYLAAVWDTYAATHDLTALQSVSGGVAGALGAIASTQQADGLTWATPTWHLAYLMDNAQAFGGLEAASAIEAALGNTTLRAEAATRASAMRAGIASLWDPSTGAYDWARQGNGWQHPTTWSTFYPDALEQVSAVEWGAIPLSRADTVMGEFTTAQPNWSNPNALVPYLNGATVQQEKVSYWPSASVAYDRVGNPSAASTGLSSVLGAAAAVGYGWPYTTGDAGEAIIAASGGPLLSSTASPAPGTGSGAGTGSHRPVAGRGGAPRDHVGSPVSALRHPSRHGGRASHRRRGHHHEAHHRTTNHRMPPTRLVADRSVGTAGRAPTGRLHRPSVGDAHATSTHVTGALVGVGASRGGAQLAAAGGAAAAVGIGALLLVRRRRAPLRSRPVVAIEAGPDRRHRPQL